MYRYLMLAGIAVTLWYWTRLVRRDKRLFWIYLTALAGAFLGAKASYLLAEGWLDWSSPDGWQRVATGKSITGALLGGYLAVEIAKKLFQDPGCYR